MPQGHNGTDVIGSRFKLSEWCVQCNSEWIELDLVCLALIGGGFANSHADVKI
jgi:hypothetical protein